MRLQQEKSHIENVFYLVRHAHADWTPDESRPLSVRGYQDAGRIAEILAGQPVSNIYSSPYKRARQTVDPLSSKLELPVYEIFDLRERLLSGNPTEDFYTAVEAVWQDADLALPGGESNAQAQQRGIAVVQELDRHHSEEHIVLSTHGNLLALVLNHFDPAYGFAFWKSMTMPDIYQLSFSRSGAVLIHRLWSDL